MICVKEAGYVVTPMLTCVLRCAGSGGVNRAGRVSGSFKHVAEAAMCHAHAAVLSVPTQCVRACVCVRRVAQAQVFLCRRQVSGGIVYIL